MMLLVCVIFRVAQIQGKTYTLGVLIPYTGTWPVGYTSAGAATAALNKINLDRDRTILRQLGADFNFVWEDTECLEEVGLVKFLNMWMKHQVDVFIGKFGSSFFCGYFIFLYFIITSIIFVPHNATLHVHILGMC